MEKVYINDSIFSEVISELVNDMIHERFLEDDIYVYDEDGNSEYTDEAQEYFNEKFDELEATFNQKWNVHSSATRDVEPEDEK